jgi:hypothetical protein
MERIVREGQRGGPGQDQGDETLGKPGHLSGSGKGEILKVLETFRVSLRVWRVKILPALLQTPIFCAIIEGRVDAMPVDTCRRSCDPRCTAPLAVQTPPTPVTESRKRCSHGHGRSSGGAGALDCDPAPAERLRRRREVEELNDPFRPIRGIRGSLYHYQRSSAGGTAAPEAWG